MVDCGDGTACAPGWTVRMRSYSTCTRCGTGDGVTPGAPSGAVHARWARLQRTTESFGIPLSTIIASVAIVAVVYLSGKLIYRLRDLLTLLAVSGFIALILNPLVVALQRQIVPRRSAAVAIVTISALMVFAGLVVACTYPLVTAVLHLANRLPVYVANAERGKGWMGHLLLKYHAEAWVRRNEPALVSDAQAFGKSALAAGKGALSLMVKLATAFMLTVFFLLEGPKLRAVILARMSPERAARSHRVAAEVRRSVTGYVAANLLTSAIAGTVVFVTLLVVGVPFAPLWGLWAAAVDFLPLIGGALAGIPTILFAVGHSVTAGIVTLVVFIIYTQIENHVLNPLVMSRTMKISPLLVLVSVVVGYSIGSWMDGLFGGFVAGLCAVPCAGAIQVFCREVRRPTERQGEAGLATTDRCAEGDLGMERRYG
jgi:predicted PurR-regulated permease PerM